MECEHLFLCRDFLFEMNLLLAFLIIRPLSQIQVELFPIIIGSLIVHQGVLLLFDNLKLPLLCKYYLLEGDSQLCS